MKVKVVVLSKTLKTEEPELLSLLKKSEKFSQLQTLNLFRNEIGDWGALAFANSRNFPNLESLFLGENSITDKGAVALIESKAFPALKILDLGKNLLGEPSALAAFQVNRKGKVRVIYRWVYASLF